MLQFSRNWHQQKGKENRDGEWNQDVLSQDQEGNNQCSQKKFYGCFDIQWLFRGCHAVRFYDSTIGDINLDVLSGTPPV